MSVRYDRVTIRMDYVEDFSSPAPGMAGQQNVTWAFVVTDATMDRVRTLLAWNREDTPKDMTAFLAL